MLGGFLGLKSGEGDEQGSLFPPLCLVDMSSHRGVAVPSLQLLGSQGLQVVSLLN